MIPLASAGGETACYREQGGQDHASLCVSRCLTAEQQSQAGAVHSLYKQILQVRDKKPKNPHRWKILKINLKFFIIPHPLLSEDSWSVTAGVVLQRLRGETGCSSSDSQSLDDSIPREIKRDSGSFAMFKASLKLWLKSVKKWLSCSYCEVQTDGLDGCEFAVSCRPAQEQQIPISCW